VAEIVYINYGAVRKEPLNSALERILRDAAEASGVDQVLVYSGGQPAQGVLGLDRKGSHRHDEGRAADIRLISGGETLSFDTPEGQSVFANFARNAAALGATGIGAAEGYMGPKAIHIGFGTKAVWGAGGRAKNAPGWLVSAVNEGWGTPTTVGRGPGVIGRNSSSDTVRALQSSLANAGFSPGKIDGKFGSRTETALRSFQQAAGLTADGAAGPQTLGALRSYVSPRDAAREMQSASALSSLPVRSAVASPPISDMARASQNQPRFASNITGSSGQPLTPSIRQSFVSGPFGNRTDQTFYDSRVLLSPTLSEAWGQPSARPSIPQPNIVNARSGSGFAPLGAIDPTTAMATGASPSGLSAQASATLPPFGTPLSGQMQAGASPTVAAQANRQILTPSPARQVQTERITLPSPAPIVTGAPAAQWGQGYAQLAAARRPTAMAAPSLPTVSPDVPKPRAPGGGWLDNPLGALQGAIAAGVERAAPALQKAEQGLKTLSNPFVQALLAPGPVQRAVMAGQTGGPGAFWDAFNRSGAPGHLMGQASQMAAELFKGNRPAPMRPPTLPAAVSPFGLNSGGATASRGGIGSGINTSPSATWGNTDPYGSAYGTANYGTLPF
jgi:peptidoglycan hydrolase-like protein with peptidoglycan-binding domain